MNAVAIDIKDILLTKGLGYSFGQNLFIGRMPEQPNECTCIFDIAGAVPDLTMTAQQYMRDGVQFIVRANNYLGAMGKAQDILEKLQGLTNIEQGGMFYTLIRTNMTPNVLDWDENNRIYVIFSMEAQRR